MRGERRLIWKEGGGQLYMLSGILPLSNSCEKSYIKESFHQRTAQVLTDARKKALLDPITTITFAIRMLALFGHLPDTEKINFDGTTIELQDATLGGKRKVFVHKNDPTIGPVSSSECQ